MDQDARKDVSGWETRVHKRKLSFNVCFGKVVHIYVSINLWGYKEENNRNPKKKKNKKELQQDIKRRKKA